MENERVRHFRQQRETEAFEDPWFGATGEEEFDIWDLGHQPPKHRQDGRSRVLVFTFVQGVNDDDSRNVGLLERLDNQPSHLVVQCFVGDFWIRLDQRDEDRSKLGVLACELSSECGEYELKVSSIFKIP